MVTLVGILNTDIKLWRKTDPNRIVLEEKLSINSVWAGAHKVNKQLTITTYRTTSKILIQGQRKAEWVEKEMEPFKEVVIQSMDSDEAVQLFERKMGFSIPNMAEIMREAEVSARTKELTNGVFDTIKEVINNDDGYITPTEETKFEESSWLSNNETKQKNNKLIMLAAATPSRKVNPVLSKAAQKRNNEQIDNNSNAIELLEVSLMQSMKKLQDRNEMLENRLGELQAKFEEEIKTLSTKNKELTNQLEMVKKEQVFVRSNVDKLVDESFQRRTESTLMKEKTEVNNDSVVDDLRNITATINDNQAKISKQDAFISKIEHDFQSRITVLEKTDKQCPHIHDMQEMSTKISQMEKNVIDNAANILSGRQKVDEIVSSHELPFPGNDAENIAHKLSSIELLINNNTTNIQTLKSEMIDKGGEQYSHEEERQTGMNIEIQQINDKLKKMENAIDVNKKAVSNINLKRQAASAVNSGTTDSNGEKTPAKRDGSRNNSFGGVVKTAVKADVVLLMDSNRQYVNSEKFWFNHTCMKVTAGNVTEADNQIRSTNFAGVKHAILHIGTNDVETRKPPDLIANEIIQIAAKLMDATQSTTYISTLPPRSDSLNNKTIQVNEHLRKSVPESIILIDNDVNLSVMDLYDKKHIRQDSVRKMVANMKDAIRATRNTLRELKKDRHRMNPQADGGEDSQRGPPNPGKSSQYPRDIMHNNNFRNRGMGNMQDRRWADHSQSETDMVSPSLQKKFDNILDVLKNIVSAVNPILVNT